MGLWLAEPAGDQEVVCGPATPALVWRRLLALLPGPVREPAAGGWRPCRRPELGLAVDVPESWRTSPSPPGWFTVTQPEDETAGSSPASARLGVMGAARGGADAVLADVRRDLADVWLIDTADDELAGRPARRHLYHHVVEGSGVVAVAWAATGPRQVTHLAVCSSAVGRFLTELDRLTGVAASVRAIGLHPVAGA